MKTELESLIKRLSKAQAYQIAAEGIYQVRANIAETKQQLKVIGFDDLVQQLADAVSTNAVLAQRIQKAFPVALVDEFQDTDPNQFTILNAIYQNTDEQLNHTAVFMIGDPKQAIYGFRGGDVYAYLAAKPQCQYQWLMDTNWRSSPKMIQGYNRLFYGEELFGEELHNEESPSLTNTQFSNKVFGHEIPYQPVKASPNAKAELFADDDYQALQFIHFNIEQENKVPQNFRANMANWCALEIQRLLQNPSAKLQPQDIAILVRDGSEAIAIKSALVEQGLSSVYLSERSALFDTPQAQQLYHVLNGVLLLENEQLFIKALTSPLMPYAPQAYYQLQQNDQAWLSIKRDFEELRQLWLTRGFMSMAFKLLHQHFVIADSDKDRVLTNILHLFELLQIAGQRHHQPHELLFWLQQHIEGAAKLNESELRLESDDNLIKIVTQHGSKGLEYPVVFVPFATRYKNPLKIGNKNIELIEYHDQNKKLQLSLGGSIEAKQAMTAENYAETIRLLYVAVTRAEQRCYILTCDFDNAALSPLGLTLNANEQTSIAEPLAALAQSDDAIGLAVIEVESDFVESDLAESDLAKSSLAKSETEHSTSGSVINSTSAIQTEQISPNEQGAQPAKFIGKIERDWWLSSFSALTKHNYHYGVSNPDRDIESQLTDGENFTELLRFQLQKGAHTGNFLHDIFELIDFNKPDYQSVLSLLTHKYHQLIATFDTEQLINWLTEVLTTPLSESFTLGDIKPSDTLREAEFYFPMENVSVAGLAKILTEHRHAYLPEYMRNIAVNLPKLNQLKGMMHGFIDLIFQADGKYYICDYKSSHLGEHFQNYQFEQLAINIAEHDYDLQYLIYSLALHRYLQNQLPNYQPARDFGGVYYLYLRGMKPQNKTASSGVFYQKINMQTLLALDALFEGKELAAVNEAVNNLEVRND